MNTIDIYHALTGKNHPTDATVLEIAEHGRVGGVSTGQGYKFSKEPDFSTKVTVSGSYTYVGIAAPGTAQSTAKWQCKKIDESVAGTTVITWADGDVNFNNTATDLTALTYS